jgi:ribonuclease E
VAAGPSGGAPDRPAAAAHPAAGADSAAGAEPAASGGPGDEQAAPARKAPARRRAGSAANQSAAAGGKAAAAGKEPAAGQPSGSASKQSADTADQAGPAASEPATGGTRSRSTRSRSARTAKPAGDDGQASGGQASGGQASGGHEAGGHQAVSAGAAAAADSERQPVPPAAFQPPLVIFQPPEISQHLAVARPAPREDDDSQVDAGQDDSAGGTASKRRRRGGRGRGKGQPGADGADNEAAAGSEPAEQAADADDGQDRDAEGDDGGPAGKRRRRRRRSGSGGDGDAQSSDGGTDDPPNTVVHVRPPRAVADSDVRAVKGSTRLEAKRQRRREGRESGRRRPPIITESEFLARREAVERVMVVRQHGDRTQIAVLEDGVLVEHYVDKASHQSYVGNVYLGKVQNVLPSMEAAFVDIGKGRNAVLYAGEVNFDASGLEGESKRIESALKSGQSILVQVTKDPIGHKGARLTSQVSLPGRYLVYVPGASMTGISRKLPDTERSRLKQILKQVMPENAGVIVRTAAEGASEEELSRDVARLSAQWEAIEKKSKTASAPDLLYSEPDLTLRVVRDIFNEDFSSLVIASDSEWDLVDEYIRYVAPHLADRLQRWDDGKEVFAAYRIDEQLGKALERKVWLPSGGSLVIDHTEAMTVIDVNTGKFTGQGGNLEQTVTRNNLEAAEEIVRQLRLRDLGGIIVIDFIDMVLESNRELVLRRLLECLARDRTKHQVAEVTSLGLVQMTRKRVGSGLLEAFSVPCEHCNGRGVIISMEPVDHSHGRGRDGDGYGKDGGRGSRDQAGSRNGGRGQGKGGQPSAAEKGGTGPADSDDGETAGSSSGRKAGSPAGDEPASGGRSRNSRSRSRSAGSRQAADAEPGRPEGEGSGGQPADGQAADGQATVSQGAGGQAAGGQGAGAGAAAGGAAGGQDGAGSANGSPATGAGRSRSRRSRPARAEPAGSPETGHNGQGGGHADGTPGLGSGEAERAGS